MGAARGVDGAASELSKRLGRLVMQIASGEDKTAEEQDDPHTREPLPCSEAKRRNSEP